MKSVVRRPANRSAAGTGLIVIWICCQALVSHARGAEPESAKPEFLGQVKPVLYVADVKSAASFYRDVLGFEFLGFAEKDGAPYYAEMSAGGLKFGLHEPQNERDRERVGKQRIYFRVADVEAHRKWIAAHGGSPGEIKKTDWMTMFTVQDADGHDIVFAETDPKVHKTNPW